MTTSVPTVSRLYRGSKVNVWHGMSQCLTPMRNHICQQQPRTSDTQQTSQPSPRLKSTRASCRHTDCNRNSWRMEQTSQSSSIKELGIRITTVTGEIKETSYIFQQISVTIQRGNMMSFIGSFNTDITITIIVMIVMIVIILMTRDRVLMILQWQKTLNSFSFIIIIK